MAEKTEPPTAKKIRDARKKGQFLFSREIVAVTTLAAVTAAIYAIKDTAYNRVTDILLLALSYESAANFSTSSYDLVRAVAIAIGTVSLTAYGVGIISSIAANLGQVGLVFSFAKMAQGLQSLNLIKNAAQMFSKKNLFTFFLNICKVIIVSITAAWVTYGLLRDFLLSPTCGFGCVVGIGLLAILYMIVIVVAIYIPIAIIDFLIQRYLYLAELKMSIDEVKQEYKESEGNPEIKGQRKQLHRELAMSDQRENVAKSSVLVTNPTHCAVALRYVESETMLPMVMAKGEGTLAKMMLKVADKENIPVYEDVSLAWDLYGDTDIGHYIPAHLMRPVATVLRFIEQQKRAGA